VKLKLSELASIAEILSSIAVVTTLVILIIDIRANTEMTRVLAYDRVIEGLNSVRGHVVENPEMAEIYTAYMAGNTSNLTATERQRLFLFVNVIFGNYEKSYFAYRYGVMGPTEWTRYEVQICVQLDRVNQTEEQRAEVSSVVTPEFMDYADRLCQKPDDLPRK
jgi:hypothetical protein